MIFPERVFGKPRLPLMHAFYSIGAMLSMGVGSAAEAMKVTLQPHFIAVGLLIGLAGFAVLGWVPRDESALRPPASPTPASPVASRWATSGGMSSLKLTYEWASFGFRRQRARS